MSYRVEVAVSGRAGCQQTECKNAGTKIEKGELRCGTWVEVQGHGSWRWKHWGCVTGKQLQNIRNNLDPEETGIYQFDRLDGYDSEDKGSLDAYPDLQEKVRRVITQGFIDQEDWNGDPEMNKLGEAGIRTAATKKRMREEAKAEANETADAEAQHAGSQAEVANQKEEKKSASKKRARAKEESDDDDDDFEESKPAPKKRTSNLKKDKAGSDGETIEVKPKAKGGRKKAAMKEEVDDDDDAFEDINPAPKKRATKTKKEEVDSHDKISPEIKPKIKGGRKKVVKNEEAGAEGTGEAEDDVKPKAKKGRKPVMKEEAIEGQNGAGNAAEVTPKAAAKKDRKKAVKKEDVEVQNSVDREAKGEPIESSDALAEDDPDTIDNDENTEAAKGSLENLVASDDKTAVGKNPNIEKAQPKKKGGRVKSNLKAGASQSTSTRSSRGKNASN